MHDDLLPYQKLCSNVLTRVINPSCTKAQAVGKPASGTSCSELEKICEF